MAKLQLLLAWSQMNPKKNIKHIQTMPNPSWAGTTYSF
jgi:hypothetical protein